MEGESVLRLVYYDLVRGIMDKKLETFFPPGIKTRTEALLALEHYAENHNLLDSFFIFKRRNTKRILEEDYKFFRTKIELLKMNSGSE